MFIEYYLEGRIVINKTKSEENVMMQLEKLKFPKLATNVDNDVDNDDDDNEEDGDNKLDVVGKYKKSFEYLTSMKLFSLTKNRIEELESELAKVEAEFETYKNTTVEQLWKNEINEFIDSYKEYLVAQSNVDSKTDKGSKTKKAAKKIKN
jgi:DNA topoisomerase-2